MLKIDELNKKLKENLIHINAEIETLKENIDKLKKEQKDLSVKIEEIEEEQKLKLVKLNEEFNTDIKSYNLKIENIDLLIKDLEDKKKQLTRTILSLKQELKSRLKEEEKKIEKELKKGIKELEIEKNRKKESLKDLIKELESKKYTITKDEKLKELYKNLEDIEKELKLSIEAKRFLDDYELKKEFINSLSDLNKKLKELQTKKREFSDFSLQLFKRYENRIKKLENRKKEIEDKIDTITQGLKELKRVNVSLSSDKKESDSFLKELVIKYLDIQKEITTLKLNLKSLADKIRTSLIKFAIDGLEVDFNLEKVDMLDKVEIEKIDELYIFANKKFEILNKTTLENMKNLIDGVVNKRLDIFEEIKEDFLAQIHKINKNLKSVDFGIIRNIEINIDSENKNILKMFEKIKNTISQLLTLLEEGSLFFDLSQAKKLLLKIESLFNDIYYKLKKDRFSLIDVVDISLSFEENYKKVSKVKIIKEESSTGGSILLKIAIAVSLLELFLKEKANLFLIVDEVSVLSTKNQKLLKDYVNKKDLGVIYITPDLPLVDIENIDIYKFRSHNGEFEVIKLISKDGIKI